MNILIAVNEAYLEPAKTMLYSLACQQSEHLVVYLLQSSIRQEKLDELSGFVRRKCHGELRVVQIDREMFVNVPKTKWWTEETYYRLIAFELLPKDMERVLWLDADIIVKGNISELYYQSFDGKCIVACDFDDIDPHERLGLCSEHRYFNAGVILYNLDELRKSLQLKDVFECIEKHRDHLHALDQDILNVLFECKVKYLDAMKYNNGVMGFSYLSRDKMRELAVDARIIHFVGAMKPWNPKGVNWADRYWWKYESKRGGRKRIAAEYWLQNIPVKAWYCMREVYYMVIGQVRKIGALFR